MGWISKRSMQTGHPLHSNKGARFTAPLKTVVRTLLSSGTMFSADTVELECGHTGRSWGGVRARCRKCEQGLPADIDEWRRTTGRI